MTTMKTLLTTTAIAASLWAAAFADNLIIGLSPKGEAIAKGQEIKQHLQFVAGEVGPGEQALFVDALNQKTICRFSVPDKKSYSAEKAKLMVNGKCVKALLAFGNAASSTDDTGAIDYMGFLRFIGQNLNLADYDAVIVQGSPIYADPNQPSLAMTDGFIPSHAFLKADRAASPYSANGLNEMLKGLPVHFSSQGISWKINDRHGHEVEKFWSLATHAMGGTLATFNGDRAELYHRVRNGLHEPALTYAYDTSDKLEMIRIPRDVANRAPIYERELSTRRPTANMIASARYLQIGISWDCTECDLDIHATPFSGAETIYFGRKRTAEGLLHKDFTRGRDLLNGLETITFNVPVNLNELELVVNLYSGDVPKGIAGEIRLAIGNDTYGLPFELKKPDQTRISIDPLKIIGVR